MMTSDPIADLLTRIRNAGMAQLKYTDIPFSKIKENIVQILKEEGFLKDFRVVGDAPQRSIRVYLKYNKDRQPVIKGLKRVSKPGLRKYVQKAQIPNILGGMGIAILSTPKGVLEGTKARNEKVGGELLCTVW